MRSPNALDAMTRWLVFTLAGVGLFALVPGSAFAAPEFAASRWLLSLHPVQLGAVVMITLAWVLFVVHVLLIPGAWRRDAACLVLAGLALGSVAVCTVAFAAGLTGVVLAAFAGVIVLHVVLCVRIDVVVRGARSGAPARGQEAATAVTALGTGRVRSGDRVGGRLRGIRRWP